MSTKAGNHRGKTAYKKARLLVLRRDNYTCFYCGNPNANQVDHVIPLATDDSLFNAINMENLVACCGDCNRRKAAKPMRVFLATTPTPPDCAERISLPGTVTITHESPMTRGIGSK
jgi:5-methylcytosine-specific restriction endonuclease McrA